MSVETVVVDPLQVTPTSAITNYQLPKLLKEMLGKCSFNFCPLLTYSVDRDQSLTRRDCLHGNLVAVYRLHVPAKFVKSALST